MKKILMTVSITVISTAFAFTMGCAKSGSLDPNTLYGKYGGYPAVKTVVDTTAEALLADSTTSPFFAVVGTAGHATVDKLKSCLDLQFTALLGGPAIYPGRSYYRGGPYECVDMKTAHKGLNISTAAFDQFVTILVAKLGAAGVSTPDINAAAPSITGMKSLIVGQ